MRTKDQGTLDAILKFVNKYYQKNRVAPTITDVAEGVGVARSTTHRYLQELSERGVLDYNRGILSAPESAKMKTAYVSAPLVGSIQCGSPEEEVSSGQAFFGGIPKNHSVSAEFDHQLRQQQGVFESESSGRHQEYGCKGQTRRVLDYRRV